jgi:hypothetical protein
LRDGLARATRRISGGVEFNATAWEFLGISVGDEGRGEEIEYVVEVEVGARIVGDVRRLTEIPRFLVHSLSDSES